tara:strand:- start:5972 stop:6286 length:315 start_codon:yes stop_codon:yes gene_type:complete
MADNKGQFIGSYYYSKSLPQGMGDKTKYDKVQYDTIGKVLRPNYTEADVMAAQKMLMQLGYLDPGSDDGMIGPMTQGAARRYQSNLSGPAIFDTMKNMFDGLFD